MGIAVAAVVGVGATGGAVGDSLDGVAVASAALCGVRSTDGDGARTDVDADGTTAAGGAVGGTWLVQPTPSKAAAATQNTADARTDISASFPGMRRLAEGAGDVASYPRRCTARIPRTAAVTRIVVHRIAPALTEMKSDRRGAPNARPMAVPIGGATSSGDSSPQPITP